MNLLFLLWVIPTWATDAEPVSLSRYFAINTCDTSSQCTGPGAKNVESANLSLELVPFHKGTLAGWHARDQNSLAMDGVVFQSEIHLVKHAKPGKYAYYIYAMLRSGKRNGKIKTINLKSLKDLGVVVLTDEPVKTAGGTIQAQLVLGPPLPKTAGRSE